MQVLLYYSLLYKKKIFKEYYCVANITEGPKSKTTGNAETG